MAPRSQHSETVEIGHQQALTTNWSCGKPNPWWHTSFSTLVRWRAI